MADRRPAFAEQKCAHSVGDRCQVEKRARCFCLGHAGQCKDYSDDNTPKPEHCRDCASRIVWKSGEWRCVYNNPGSDPCLTVGCDAKEINPGAKPGQEATVAKKTPKNGNGKSKTDDGKAAEHILGNSTRFIDCQLTSEEIVDVKSDLSDICIELSRTEVEAEKAKAKLKRLTESRKTKTQILETGVEMRSVECTERLIRLRVITTRNDTGEVISDRPSTSEERQTALGFSVDVESEADRETTNSTGM